MNPHAYQPDPDADTHSEDYTVYPICQLCGLDADHPIHELAAVPLGYAEDDNPLEDERRDDELTGDRRSFTPPDEPGSGFDVREPETVADLFEDFYGQSN